MGISTHRPRLTREGETLLAKSLEDGVAVLEQGWMEIHEIKDYNMIFWP